MAKNPYRYLNLADNDPFFSRMAAEIAKAQTKAPPAQWAAFIKGLATKGVKGREIEESLVLEYLKTSTEKSLTREDIVAWIRANTPTVKEIDLAKPKYSGWHHGGQDQYIETLYVANSQADNIDDRLEDIRFEIEELDFNLDLLVADPQRAIDLSQELATLEKKRKSAVGHHAGHFSSLTDSESGEEIRNVIGHCRHTIRGSLYFIDELQSDWAQHGRKRSWTGIPKGPFVTDTETWAGLLLKRQIQRACLMPGIDSFSWIRAHLRNGQLRDPESNGDGLEDFYMKIFPKIIDKLLAGTGEKVSLMDVKLTTRGGVSMTHQLPGFKITDRVREKMSGAQTLYSNDVLPRDENAPISHAQRVRANHALSEMREMLGSSVSIRLAEKLVHIASGKEIAGRHINELIEVSLRARDPSFALSHEAWHYAHHNLIGALDRAAIERAFADGSALNTKVRMALVKDGAPRAALLQCKTSEEAAAYGFALWKQGKINITDADQFASEQEQEEQGGSFRWLHGLYTMVAQAFIKMAEMVRRVVGESQQGTDVKHADQVFKLLASNRLAKDVSDAPAHLHSDMLSVVDQRSMRTTSLASQDATREISDSNMFEGIPVRTSRRPRAA